LLTPVMQNAKFKMQNGPEALHSAS
jgi:hypothetical protein